MNDIHLCWTLDQSENYYGSVVLSPEPPVDEWITINTKVFCRSQDEIGLQLLSVINISVIDLRRYIHDLRSLNQLRRGEAHIVDVDKCIDIYIKQGTENNYACVDCCAFYPEYSPGLGQTSTNTTDDQKRNAACIASVIQARANVEALDSYLNGWKEYSYCYINY